MTLTAGTRLGPYEITAPLGAGGMGEVYRATDTNLKRQVAIKVLPASVAADPERLARFQREAEILAALNHPNIAHIHGLEKSDRTVALVMELVEGPTLADRIAKGPIPLDEALPLAKQVAEALEAAHEQGIIHRDLKPANIKVRDDGKVKVLDFGLAKALDPSGASTANATNSPTISMHATQAGFILGTAAYMSPEQAVGKPVDKRSDVWAFGAVLLEMLTGRQVFSGETVSDVLASVLKDEPDWAALPGDTPASIRRLLRRCLEKNRKRRLSDVADARLEIEDVLITPASDVPAMPATGSRGGSRNVALSAAAAFLVAGAAAGSAVWIATRPSPARVTRTTIQTSGATAFVNTQRSAGGNLAITPDGSRVVYTAAGQLVVRRLDQFEPTTLSDLSSPTQPFIDPTGQWVGFFDGMVLKKVAITGGPAVTVFRDSNPSGGPLGATWGPDGTIVYAGAAAAGLKRVSAAGGEAESLTTLDPAQGEVRHLRPFFLPGGRALLFTIFYVKGPESARIAVLDLQTGARTVLLAGNHARYLPSGHLVYGTEGALRAVAFDIERRAVVGTPVPVVAPVAASLGQGAYEYDVAADGTLVYLATSLASPPTRTLMWVDRQGRETPLGIDAGFFVHPRLAPDGMRAAVLNAGNTWMWDFARARLTPGTLDGASISIWLDSRRFVFSSTRAGGTPNLYVQAADGTGTATRLTDSPTANHPTGVTPDGTRIVFNQATLTQQGDIRLLTLSPTPVVTPLIETRFDERGGVVSPDGRWLAYESNRSGAYEVYVQPFPAVEGGLWQISSAGGVQPLWARNGRELFYIAPDHALMAVSVEARGSLWSARAPTRLVDGRYFAGGEGTTVRQYDVAPDGQRFLMMKEEATKTDLAPSINVIQNWTEELKARVPTK